MQPLTGTFFLQSLSLLASLARRRAKPNQNIPVACRKQDLMDLDKATVSRWWDHLVAGYHEAAQFMRNQGILAARIMPYSTLIIPLAAILSDLLHRKGEVALTAAVPKIGDGTGAASLANATAARPRLCLQRTLFRCWTGLMVLNSRCRPHLQLRSDYLQEIVSIRNAIYKGVLCLLARGHAQDFGGGGLLSTELFFDTSQDHHHIFPTYAMSKLGINDPRAETMVNKTLIGAAVNRSIGGSLPSDYVQNWRKKLGTTQANDMLFDDILRTHCIDVDLLASDRWDDFVRDRREKLRALIAGVCGGNVLPFSDETELDVDLQDDAEE